MAILAKEWLFLFWCGTRIYLFYYPSILDANFFALVATTVKYFFSVKNIYILCLTTKTVGVS